MCPSASWYEPFDPEYLRDLIERCWGPVVEAYFRPRLLGAHRLPERGPAILAANHSGNAFPYDGIVLDGLLWARSLYDPEQKFRTVFEKELTTRWWMRPFGIDNFWRRGGGVDLTFDNFDRLLARGEKVIYYPEGVPGIGKGFFRRYELQRFSTSFAILAARHDAPVYPVHIINAEWVLPFCFTVSWINRVSQSLWHAPFLPLPAAPLGMLFPWMWYLSLPARMVFVVGEPIDMAHHLRRAGVTDFEQPDREMLRRATNEIQQKFQTDLDRCVKKYGRWPYQARLLRRRLQQQLGQLGRVLPPGWPPLFVRHHRDRHRPPPRNRLQSWLRDWDLLGFYLPLGWPLLALARRLRRPPYGYRGLGREERWEKEGTFHWHLNQRPLPPKRHDRLSAQM